MVKNLTDFVLSRYHHLYLFGMMMLIFFIYQGEIIELWKEWFADGNLFHKGPIVWLICFIVASFTIDKNTLSGAYLTLGGLVFSIITLMLIGVFKTEYPLMLVILLFVSSWFFAIEKNFYHKTIIISLFLFFSLPYYNFISPYLQITSALVVEKWLSFFNIPVLLQEYYIAIPRGQILIEESCNGARYLANNLILLFLYSLLSNFNGRQFFLAFLSTVLHSLVINWIRIFIIIVVAHNWGFDVPFFVKDHGNLGWVIYVIMLVPFFYSFIRIERMTMPPISWVKYYDYRILNVPAVSLLLPIFTYAII